MQKTKQISSALHVLSNTLGAEITMYKTGTPAPTGLTAGASEYFAYLPEARVEAPRISQVVQVAAGPTPRNAQYTQCVGDAESKGESMQHDDET